MQIAKIVPKIRTKEEIFDYAISPDLLPMIKIGTLVQIPMKNRKVEGIIVDIKKHSKIERLKPIIKIIDPRPVVNEQQIKLAKWISEYYLTPLNLTLFLFFVPPAKRAIKSITKNDPDIYYKNSENISDANSSHITPLNLLVRGDFLNRMKLYKKAIIQTQKRNKQVLIIVPDLDLIKYFNFPNAIILHAGFNKTIRWKNWNKIRENKISIVIGSQSALFAPLNNLGLIIIDQEENETYKNDRQPRIWAPRVSLKMGQILGASIIFGSLTPTLESNFMVIQKKIREYKFKIKDKPQITIVDQSLDKKIISTTLENEIRKHLEHNNKVVLFLDRKGEGIRYTCLDCGWISVCPTCSVPYVPTNDKLKCFRCNKDINIPTKCEKCQSVNLKSLGITTGSLESIVAEIFKTAKIIRIEKDLNNNPMNREWDIAIITSFALKFPFPSIGLSAIIDAEQTLNLPDFRIYEKSFQKFFKVLKIAKKGLIQTRLPQSNFILALAKLNYDLFFNEELITRGKYEYPPLIKLIRIITKNPEENKSKSLIEELYIKIIKLTQNNNLSMVETSKPHPAWKFKLNNQYRYQILLKVKNGLPHEIRSLLNNLDRNYAVDVDPIDML